MKSMNTAALLSAAAVAAMGAGVNLPSAPMVNARRPTPPRIDTKLAREIAAHNEAVERRKAERKAKKRTKDPKQ